uniref:Uncharacterized protein n=1 Tax=Trichuris muris TaxID=70415 RepID=A0A5S6QJ83_TRIMR
MFERQTYEKRRHKTTRSRHQAAAERSRRLGAQREGDSRLAPKNGHPGAAPIEQRTANSANPKLGLAGALTKPKCLTSGTTAQSYKDRCGGIKLGIQLWKCCAHRAATIANLLRQNHKCDAAAYLSTFAHAECGCHSLWSLACLSAELTDKRAPIKALDVVQTEISRSSSWTGTSPEIG